MKKFMSILLSLSLIVGTTTIAFAEGSDTTDATQTTPKAKTAKLTPEQQKARDEYLKVHFDDMNQLVTLRQQTKDAEAANNTLAKQIKDKIKAKSGLNTDSIAKLKDLSNQRKTLGEEAKKLQQQRVTLKNQYKDAVKAKDVDKMKSIEQQILDLNAQVAALKSKDDAIKAQVEPLKEELKSLKDSNKQSKESLKTQVQQAKTLHDTIKGQEKEKEQLWNTYKENIKNKDYTAAGETFNKIISMKSSILDNIKQRGTILNQILSSLN